MKRVKKIGAGINFPVQLLAWIDNMTIKTEIHVGLTKEGLTYIFKASLLIERNFSPF